MVRCIVVLHMPFFENAGDYVPDLSPQQIRFYQALLSQKAEITRQIQALIESVPKVQRPKWHCFRCNHDWNGYFPQRKPKFCVKCKSSYWDRERVKSPDVLRSNKVNREASLEPIALPKSLASVTGMTPPPVFNATDEEVTRLADLIAEANKMRVRNRFAEDIIPEEVPSDVEPEPAPVPVTGEASVDSPGQKSVLDDDGPHCCSNPTIIDGFCVNCGDGLEVRHGQ